MVVICAGRGEAGRAVERRGNEAHERHVCNEREGAFGTERPPGKLRSITLPHRVSQLHVQRDYCEGSEHGKRAVERDVRGNFEHFVERVGSPAEYFVQFRPPRLRD